MRAISTRCPKDGGVLLTKSGAFARCVKCSKLFYVAKVPRPTGVGNVVEHRDEWAIPVPKMDPRTLPIRKYVPRSL